jgi:hypothetical protein
VLVTRLIDASIGTGIAKRVPRHTHYDE